MMQKGFTLIETIIYIALLSLMLGGVLLSIFQILQGSLRTGEKTTTQEEGNFILRKINWTLTGLSGLPTIGGSGCAQTLTTSKATVRLNTSDPKWYMEMKETGGIFLAITTDNASTTCLKFSLISAIGGAPTGIAATTTINGVNFTITKYMRP